MRSPVGHVLIPLDGTPPAEQILEPAAELARLMGVGVTLLQAIPPVAFGGWRDDGSVVTAEALAGATERLRAKAEKYLEAVAVRLRSRGLPVRVVVAPGQDPASAVLDRAAALPGGLIALTTHGRGGLARLLLGSIADRVVRGARGPVLLLRERPLTADGSATAGRPRARVRTPAHASRSHDG
jgi:nucleotide-binding universal stress UspA family protein